MLEHLKQATNFTTTTNGAVTHKSSESYLLDFFARGGSMRNSSEKEIIQMFSKAYSENPEYTLKALFLHRDIRGGNGERRLFRVITKWIAQVDPQAIDKLVPLIAEYGRYDDLVVLLDSPISNTVGNEIARQLTEDVNNLSEGKPISLMAKWLPSISTSSKKKVLLAKRLSKDLGMTYKDYRKTVSKLRKNLNLLESNMSQNTWENVKYSALPSQAMLKHKSAFHRNDAENYLEYLDSLSKGETKVNSGSLYPYQLVKKAMETRYSNSDNTDRILFNQMWEALPNTINTSENSIAVIDVSGSMYGTPITVAVSLGLYMAERNTGTFHNHFITFSESPSIVEVVGHDFVDKVNNILKADWGMSTNLESVFDLILQTAIKEKTPQDELPTKLFIISDMQFNNAFNHSNINETFYQTMQRKFEEHGYMLPKIVFWNVNGVYGQHPVTKDTKYAQLVSGFSQNMFKAIFENTDYSPYDFMMETLNSERYAAITYYK